MIDAGKGNGELLIVEDDHDFVDDLFAMWSPPLPVARAESGAEAVEYLRRSTPALVLLDLNLPHFLASDDDDEGLKILSYIRSRVGIDVPVIIITRENTQETRAHATSLGVLDFLPKPLDVSRLEAVVCNAILRDRGHLS